MKKLYITFLFSAVGLFVLAQSGRKAALSKVAFSDCKNCTPQIQAVIDTLCNFESDDTLAIYYADGHPFDSGWAIGHNAYQDMAWAERYTVTGNANVLGGAYLLWENSGSCSGTGTANAHVYSTAGPGGKPGASLGSLAIPLASATVNGTGHLFMFSSPIPVNNSFFMGFELGNYTFGGPDTVAVITSRHGNRSTSNPDQNCAKWNDGNWYFELTENFGLKVTYGLCAIVDIAGGVENYVGKGDLNLYAAYPNPASGNVVINYALNNASKVEIEIYDAQGKSILKQNNGVLSTGMYRQKIDVSSFAEGNYFYRVSAENGTVYSRFTVVK